MSAPWGVEFNEDVLGLVVCDFGEVGSDENLNGVLVPVFRQVLGEEVPLEFTFKEGTDEFFDVRGSNNLKWLRR